MFYLSGIETTLGPLPPCQSLREVVAGLQGLGVDRNQLGVVGADHAVEGFLHGFQGQGAGSLDPGAQGHHVGQFHIAQFVGDVVDRDVDRAVLAVQQAFGDERGVDDLHAVGMQPGLELGQRGLVEHDDGAGRVDQGRTHGMLVQHHGAVGGTAAHLGAVDRDEAHFEAVFHTGLGQQVADEHDALAAETGDDDVLILSHAAPRFRPGRSRLCTRPEGIQGSWPR